MKISNTNYKLELRSINFIRRGGWYITDKMWALLS